MISYGVALGSDSGQSQGPGFSSLTSHLPFLGMGAYIALLYLEENQIKKLESTTICIYQNGCWVRMMLALGKKFFTLEEYSSLDLIY